MPTTAPQRAASVAGEPQRVQLVQPLSHGRAAEEARSMMNQHGQSLTGMDDLLVRALGFRPAGRVLWFETPMIVDTSSEQNVVIAASDRLYEYKTVGLRHLTAELDALLADLAMLEDGWDGYGAHHPTPWALATVRSVLNTLATVRPQAIEDVYLVPATDGGVRLEWMRMGSRDLVVALPPDSFGQAEIYRRDRASGFIDDMKRWGTPRLTALLDWLNGA